MGQAIIRWASISIPAAIVFLAVAVYFVGDVPWNEAFTTALLPGVLLGSFGGGFAGMAMTMDVRQDSQSSRNEKTIV